MKTSFKCALLYVMHERCVALKHDCTQYEKALEHCKGKDNNMVYKGVHIHDKWEKCSDCFEDAPKKE